MNRTVPSLASDRRPEPITHLQALRENLALEDSQWREFLRHARGGFVDYEKATSIYPELGHRLRDVPDDWWGSTEQMGYVFLRVARQADANLAVLVAWNLLQLYDPEVDDNLIAPGTGAAWLLLSRTGHATPVEPAELARQALLDPEHFFYGSTEDDILPQCRLVLEGRENIHAWDVHAVVAAVAQARIHVRAPFRLFSGLMSADWLASTIKREFCRGLLSCAPEVERLREHRAALEAATAGDDGERVQFPRGWNYLAVSGVADHLPTLKRHAVFALTENLGEPASDVIAEFFLKKYGSAAATEAVSEGVLDLIGLRAQEFDPTDLRKWINKAVKRGLAPVRQAAYRIGAEHFGLQFARPALNDDSGTIRKWARNLLANGRLQPARKTRPKSPR